MPLPSLSRSLELGAALIEHDLHGMRESARRLCREAQERPGFDGRVAPITSSHENDLMKAVEWATAAATLRVLAANAKMEEHADAGHR